jgi:hypothetical protein
MKTCLLRSILPPVFGNGNIIPFFVERHDSTDNSVLIMEGIIER